jgi:DNA-binding transcriptional MerR regulator
VAGLCRASGIARSTLRVYEASGLVRPDFRTASGYRKFDAEQVDRIRVIRLAKDVGFSLREIRELLKLIDVDGLDAERVRAIALARLPAIEARIGALETMRDFLRAVADDPSTLLEDPECRMLVDYAARLGPAG